MKTKYSKTFIPRHTAIQWADFSANPWLGCRKVSAGCRYCYMHRDMDGNNPNRVRWNQKGFEKIRNLPPGSKVFTCSMSDFFIEEADLWRPKVWMEIKYRQDLKFLILTKRVHRINECLPNWGKGYRNVWLGVSIEDQKVVDRVIELARLKAIYPNITVFLSLEPLIGPIDFKASPGLWKAFQAVDWVIIGGESGNETGKYRYRKCNLIWMYSLLAQCDVLNIPVFVKQLGTHLGNALNNGHSHGGNLDKFPKGLKRADFPK